MTRKINHNRQDGQQWRRKRSAYETRAQSNAPDPIAETTTQPQTKGSYSPAAAYRKNIQGVNLRNRDRLPKEGKSHNRTEKQLPKAILKRETRHSSEKTETSQIAVIAYHTKFLSG